MKPIWRGLFWNGLNLLANKGVSIVARLLLARLLAPEYFGLVAMVVVILSLVGIFIDFGLQNVLIQRPRDKNSSVRYSSAFWFLLLGGIGWTAIFAVISVPAVVWFFDEPKLAQIALLMAPSLFFKSLAIVPEVLLVRALKFRPIAIAEVSATVLSSGIALGLALLGAEIIALIIQQLLQFSVRSILIWRLSRWRPRLVFQWASLKEIVGISGYMLGARVLHYIRTNIDTIVIGSILGATSLGIHTIAYAITENIRTQIARIISRVMLPVYSKIQDEPELIRIKYLQATRAMTLIFFPFSLFIVIFAEPAIEFLFSEEWYAAIAPTKLLAIGGMIYAISGPSAEVLQGVGRVKALFVVSGINVFTVSIPTMWIMTDVYGLVGAAAAMLISFITMRILSFFVMRRYLEITLIDISKAISPAVILAFLLSSAALFSPGIDVLVGLVIILLAYAALSAVCFRDTLLSKLNWNYCSD